MIYTFLLVLALGVIAAVILFEVVLPADIPNAEARGERFGQGLGALAVASAIVAGLIQQRRVHRDLRS